MVCSDSFSPGVWRFDAMVNSMPSLLETTISLLGMLAPSPKMLRAVPVPDDDFRDFLRHCCRCADSASSPAPVVHPGLDGDERLASPVGFTARFQVSAPPRRPSSGVAFDDAVGHRRRRRRVCQLYLFIPNALGFQAVGRFHGDEAKKLHQVVCTISRSWLTRS